MRCSENDAFFFRMSAESAIYSLGPMMLEGSPLYYWRLVEGSKCGRLELALTMAISKRNRGMGHSNSREKGNSNLGGRGIYSIAAIAARQGQDNRASIADRIGRPCVCFSSQTSQGPQSGQVSSFEN
jgi:hypothetical protein